MSVFYKFNSELNFSHVGFDGLHISVADLKKAILHQKRLGKSDFDLLISNAQTKEEYVEDDCLIPKNTSLTVARVPISSNQYKKWEHQTPTAVTHNEQQNTSSSASTMDLSKMNGSEEDKINAMITQSTLDYDPTNYQRVRGTQQSGEVPHHYRCHRCHKSGHWIKNCPLNPPIKDHHMKVRAESKKMTGIPRSLRENPPDTKETDLHQFVEQKKEIPEDLLCSICKNIFKDAVMIPCCGSSFCDECIRTALLETDDNECPECSEKGTSPGSLIPNRFLRNAVASFHSDSTSLSSRDKQPESTSKPQEIMVNSNEPGVEEKAEKLSLVEPFTEPTEFDDSQLLKPDQVSEDEEEDDDDNITVTVPSASQQSGAEFRETIVLLPHRQDSSSHDSESNLEYREKSREKPNYSDTPSYSGGYYQGSTNNNNNNNSYDGPSQKSMSNSYQENVDKNYQSHSMNNPNPYHQSSHGYNQPQQHHQNMHMQQQHRPQQYGHQGQYHQSGHHQPYYNHHQQNMRPMRYEHGNFHGMNKHHNLQPMHAPMNEHYGGMRYQPPSTNLASMVTQNIQQRFGTGIIDDPLEAFNKIMREKEMRKDRFKRSRSPLRQYSPDMRQKSPIRRRKRTRSFSSGSSNKSYSRSRSRSYERHYPKENVHSRGDYRGDLRRRPQQHFAERKKSESRNSRITHRNRTPNETGHSRKSNHDNVSSSHENRQEKSKPLLPTIEQPSINDTNNSTNDGEPPPPGLEVGTSTILQTNSESQMQQPQKEDEKIQTSLSEKETKGSADESKHSKKSRDKKKHKKEKKKKRDRKEKKSTSKSNTPEMEMNSSLVKESLSKEQMDEKPSSEKEDGGIKEHFDDTLTENDNDTNNDDSKFDDYIEPELSKWERDEGHNEKNSENQRSQTSGQDELSSNSEVTSEIIKRAENAIFAKAVNAIRPQEVNKASSSLSSSVSKSESLPVSSTVKKTDSDRKYESVQVTADNSGNRSIEIKSEENNSSRNKSDVLKPPSKSSIKDRLGKKIDARSRSRSKSRENRRQHQDYDRKNARRPYQLNSCISSVPTYSDRKPEKKSSRRSRSIDNRSVSKKHEKSRSRSPNRNDHKKLKLSDDKRSHYKTVDEKHDSKSVRDKRTKSSERETNRSRHRSRSPKPSTSNKANERSRSSSTESKKHKKKKKKEKKSKKKSRG